MNDAAKVSEVSTDSASGSPDFDFQGTAGDFFIVALKSILISAITGGLGQPWGQVWVEQWMAENTKVRGKQTEFRGKGGDLFLKCLKWGLLSIITLGIYLFWAMPEFLKWRADNTYIID
jgi:uncharacterized membrane protein YjgN (DUF898 family)